MVTKRKKKSPVKVIPLGGLGEIGKNMFVIEYEDDIILVDSGIAFPESDMLGIDLVIPNISYLISNKDKIKCILITHGHEDHIGAVPYVLKQINVPVYGTKLSIGLIKNKLSEHSMLENSELITVSAGDKIKKGVFSIEFIRTNHSIADSVALAISTPQGLIVHTSDFKIDYTPIVGEMIDLARFAELGRKGVKLLLADSTNSEKDGYTMSEKTVGKTFSKLFDDAKGRIIVATFASNVHRVQQIITAAHKYNRKIAIIGRSMINIVNIASELGYLELPEGIITDINKVKNLPDNKVLIITTGSQGEPMSALTRISTKEHRQISVKKGDTVVISSTPIPGNEKPISNVINTLIKQGANVIYEALEDVHVSGHACKEELKLMHSLIKPKFFIPVHGEYKHLAHHADIASELGMDRKNIFVMENGQKFEFTNRKAKVTGKVASGKVLVDGLGVGDVGNIVLRDRKHLSEDGLFIVVISIDQETGNIVSEPDVISRGFIYVRESEALLEESKKVVNDAIEGLSKNQKKNWSYTKNIIRRNLNRYLYEKTKRNPMILPIIIEV